MSFFQKFTALPQKMYNVRNVTKTLIVGFDFSSVSPKLIRLPAMWNHRLFLAGFFLGQPWEFNYPQTAIG